MLCGGNSDSKHKRWISGNPVNLAHSALKMSWSIELKTLNNSSTLQDSGKIIKG